MMKRVEQDNLFEIDNARNLSLEQMVSTFIETRAFTRLLSAKNHIVLGARGSGKTALAKMLSHDHLVAYCEAQGEPSVRSIKYIGIYVPTRLEWVSSLKNKPWDSEAEAERFFQWRFNLATCMAFLRTLRSCIGTYKDAEGDDIYSEREITREVSESWLGSASSEISLSRLLTRLQETAFRKNVLEQKRRVGQDTQAASAQVGSVFDTELFAPLRRGIEIAEQHLSFPENATWLLILDEAEFLHDEFIRIVNSHLRSFSGNLCYKITTMPYAHTLATNTNVPLDEGHDFEYVYIDQGPDGLFGVHGEDDPKFARQLFNRRLQSSPYSSSSVSLTDLLGSSALLDPKPSLWTSDSTEMNRLRRFSSEKTVVRAERLLSSEPKKFENEISRKMHGALLLREAVADLEGASKLDVYAGESMLARCSDSNPRRLIRLFNRMISKARPRSSGQSGLEQLAASTQTEILVSFGSSLIRRVQSEEDCGPQLYELLRLMGEYMRIRFHDAQMTTDQVSSVVFDDSVPASLWPLFERAVGLGLLFPNINLSQPDQLPKEEGTFHMAYALALHFKILPRRGVAHSLGTMLTKSQIAKLSENVEQYGLFDGSEEKES